MPNWSGSTRKARLPHNWATIRKQILTRDKHRCQWPTRQGICGAPANQVDHKERGDNHAPENLQALCTPHHQQKTGQEGGTAPRRNTIRKRTKRPQEPHPGITPPQGAPLPRGRFLASRIGPDIPPEF